MLWTIRKVVGDAVYTSDVHHAWVRVYSRMLSLMVPLAVKYEMETFGVRQEQRIKDEKATLSLQLDSRSNCATPAIGLLSVASTCISPGFSDPIGPDKNLF